MFIGNKTGDRLASAILRNRALSREGLLEHLFAWMFKGLVYPQIWEDPEVDLEALALRATAMSWRSPPAAATSCPISPPIRPASPPSTSTRRMSRSTG